MARTVTAPDGVRWRIGRVWVPVRPRLRDTDLRDLWPDLAELGFEAGLIAGLAAIVVGVLLFAVIWPIIAIAIELVILLFVLIGAVGGRVLFGRPWTVLARSRTAGSPREYRWQVRGWRPGGRLIDDVANAIEHGTQIPPGLTAVGLPPVL